MSKMQPPSPEPFKQNVVKHVEGWGPGTSPPKLTIPTNGSQANPTSTSQPMKPAQTAQKPLENARASAHFRTPRSLNLSKLSDPLTMLPAVRHAMLKAPMIDLYVIDPDRVCAATVSAKLLAAYSSKARRNLADMKENERPQVNVGHFSHAAVLQVVKYLHAAAASDEGLPDIYTNVMSYDEWLQFHRVVECLEMDHVIGKLAAQAPRDIRPLDLEGTLDVYVKALGMVTTPMKALKGKCFAFANNKVYGHHTDLADLETFLSKTPDEAFTEKAIRQWAEPNYLTDLPVHKLADVSDVLRTSVLKKWQARKNYEQRKGKDAAARRYNAQKRNRDVVYNDRNEKVKLTIGEWN